MLSFDAVNVLPHTHGQRHVYISPYLGLFSLIDLRSPISTFFVLPRSLFSLSKSVVAKQEVTNTSPETVDFSTTTVCGNIVLTDKNERSLAPAGMLDDRQFFSSLLEFADVLDCLLQLYLVKVFYVSRCAHEVLENTLLFVFFWLSQTFFFQIRGE